MRTETFDLHCEMFMYFLRLELEHAILYSFFAELPA